MSIILQDSILPIAENVSAFIANKYNVVWLRQLLVDYSCFFIEQRFQ
jgi:hypothetical protein